MLRKFVALAACVCAAAAFAQPASDTDWKEAEVPPPPPLRMDGLVPIEVTGAVDLRYAVDPQSVGIGSDGVVRYVVVATSRAGAVNAMYEGVRCGRAEYRVYARSSGQGWRPVETEWRSLYEGVEARHARAVARGGACFGPAPNRSAQQVVRDLRTPDDRKFGGSGAP
jgi:hypothetical protein